MARPRVPWAIEAWFLALRLARPLLALAALASLLALGLELRKSRPWDLLVLVPALTSVALNLLWLSEGDAVAGYAWIVLILALPGSVLIGLRAD